MLNTQSLDNIIKKKKEQNNNSSETNTAWSNYFKGGKS